MDTGLFKRTLKSRVGVVLSDRYVLFRKKCTLYDSEKDNITEYGTVENLLCENSEVAAIVAKADNFDTHYDGGRGSRSLSGKYGGGFSHADDGGGYGGGDRRTMFAASFNALGSKQRTYDETLRQFARKYADADHEFGITVQNDSGFVTQHVEGAAHSVGIWGKRGETVIHNHPSGSNFSDSDLISVSTSNESSIVAVGRGKTYTFSKGPNFNPVSFVRAVKHARWPIEYDYNKGADWWLRKNAGKFGYTYTASNTKR